MRTLCWLLLFGLAGCVADVPSVKTDLKAVEHGTRSAGAVPADSGNGAPSDVSEPAGETTAADNRTEEATGADGENEAEGDADESRSFKMKTLGGRQFWGDVLFFHGWRIQHCVLDGRYRLLDEDDYPYASGTFEQCKARLDQIRKERQLPPMSGKGVILIHGIIRSSKSMSALKKPLEEHGYTVFGFDYPSTRVSLAEAADYLHRVIQSLEGIERIDFVVHSMGGLVVRAYLQQHHDPRITRMVMIATPNQGAEMADMLKRNPIYRVLLGPAGQQLGTDNGFLPVPDFEFGIIAGSRGKPGGYNPLIPGDDDGTVSVESTRLAGAADFVTVKGLHSFLPSNPQVVEYAVRFLTTGHFRTDGTRQPIPADAAEASTAAPNDSAKGSQGG